MNCWDVLRSDLGMVRSEMVSLELPEVAPGEVCTRVTSAVAGVGVGGGAQGWEGDAGAEGMCSSLHCVSWLCRPGIDRLILHAH